MHSAQSRNVLPLHASLERSQRAATFTQASLLSGTLSEVAYKARSQNRSITDEQITAFLPPDAERWHGICYGNVTVCVSVTLMYVPKRLRTSPHCSPAIQVFS